MNTNDVTLTGKELAKIAACNATAHNDGLRGDDCKGSRQFLLGYAGVFFEQNMGRFMNDEEEEVMIGVINKFLKTNVNRNIRLLDKVLNVFVDGDKDLADSTCECCKAKRELLKELKANYLVK